MNAFVFFFPGISFYLKHENLGLIDAKSPTASCWWNENLDSVNILVQQLSMGLQQRWLSASFDKKKKFFGFFIPEVQCVYIFKIPAKMKGGKMKSISDEVKLLDLLISPLARLQASGNLA